MNPQIKIVPKIMSIRRSLHFIPAIIYMAKIVNIIKTKPSVSGCKSAITPIIADKIRNGTRPYLMLETLSLTDESHVAQKIKTPILKNSIGCMEKPKISIHLLAPFIVCPTPGTKTNEPKITEIMKIGNAYFLQYFAFIFEVTIFCKNFFFQKN